MRAQKFSKGTNSAFPWISFVFYRLFYFSRINVLGSCKQYVGEVFKYLTEVGNSTDSVWYLLVGAGWLGG